ncbi:MAG: DNA alkylation repair protein [Bacteroidia bacterium]|nr:DNA alkylation repair protein [Bacteroidia bacterium]
MSDPETIKKELLTLLEPHIEPGFREGAANFFKDDEVANSLGVRTKTVRDLSKSYFDQHLKKVEINFLFLLADVLFESGLSELRVMGLDWLSRRKKEMRPAHFAQMESWLQKYVRNWADCDNLCCGPLGELILLQPETRSLIKEWPRSSNRWVRRAACVAQIPGIRKDKALLDSIFQAASLLFQDQDLMVQKGYGWTLKVASTRYPEPVLQFLKENQSRMSRLGLRYALEKYPPEVQKSVL